MSGTTNQTTYQVRYRVKGTTVWSPLSAPTTNWQTSITGLVPNTTYDVEVIATNSLGSTSSQIVEVTTTAVAPSAPGTPVISNIGTTSVVMNWPASGTGTGPLTYQPFMQPSGGVATKVGTPTSGTSATITGLSPNTTYSFWVVATNPIGSATSPSASATTLSAGTPPNAPTNLAVSSVQATQLVLSWSASTTGTGPILYQPKYRVHGSTSWTSFGSAISGTSATITGLQAATSYDFQVDASNAVQTVSSAAFTASTGAAPVAPSAPTNLTATSIASSGMSIGWTNSATGTAPITYQLQYRLSGSGSFANYGSPVSAGPVAVSNLSTGTSYDFRVVATNSVNSTTSATLTQATSATASVPPSAPSGFQVATASTPGSFLLSWNASSGTTPITYTPQYRVTGTSTWSSGTATTGLTSTISGLAINTSYDFQILATNSAGGPTASAVVSASFTAVATTWYPFDDTGMALSNGNLTATGNSTSEGGVRSTSSYSTGKYVFEMKLTTAIAHERFGIANSSWPENAASGLGGDNNGVGIENTGTVYLNVASVGSAAIAWTAGNTAMVAVDFGAKKLWVTQDGTNWDASGSGDNPATGTGGYSFGSIAAGPYKIAYGSPASSAGTSSVTGSQNSGASQPVVSGPASGTVTAGGTLNITGLNFTDTNQPHGGVCTINIACSSGVLSLPTIVGGSSTYSGDGTSSLQVNDTFNNCVSDIQGGLHYTPGTGVNSDTVSVQLWNQLGENNTINIPITVTAGSSASKTLNVGEQAFAHPIPSGFSAWDDFPPGSPSSVSAIASGSSVTISWVPPTVGQAPITFQIQHRVTGTQAWTRDASGITADTYTLSNLSLSTTYDIQVTASNPIGNSNPVTVTATTGASSGLPGDATGTTAYRIADMLEIFGSNCFPDGQDGPPGSSSSSSWAQASAYAKGINWIVGSSGCGMFMRIYANNTGLDEPWMKSVAASCPYTKFTSCANYVQSSTSVVTQELTDMAGQGVLAAGEGWNEPNNGGVQNGGASIPVSTCLSTQQAIYSAAGKKVPVLLPSVIDTGSNTYFSDYVGSSQNAFIAAADWCNGHHYPGHGAPNNDMGRESDYLTSVTGLPAAITEFHPLLYNNQGNNTAAAAYYTLIALISGYVDHSLKALIWYSFFSYSGYSPDVGLFMNYDPTQPSTSAIALRALYQLTGDPGGAARHTFTQTKLDFTVTGQPGAASFSSLSGGRYALFQNSAGVFFLLLWNEQNSFGGTTTPWTVKFNSRTPQSITEYPISTTTTQSAPMTAVQTVTNKNSIVCNMAAEVHLLVIQP